MSKTRSKEDTPDTPLTAAQQDRAVQLLAVAEVMAWKVWRRKRWLPRTTPDDYHDEAQWALLQWVTENTNPDGSDPLRRPSKLFLSHLNNRLGNRLSNYRRDSYRSMKGEKEMRKNLAGSRGSRKGWANDVYKDGDRKGRLLRSGPVWQLLQEEPAASDPNQDPADVQSLVETALRQMMAIDPEATECFWLKHAKGLKIEEIARQTGLSRDQVNRRLRKAEHITTVIQKEFYHADQ